jgi:hypothetical protein
MPRVPFRAAAPSAAVLIVACLLLAACGGSSGGKSTTAATMSTNAGPAFPVAGERPLKQVLAGIKPGPMLAPAVGVLEPGLNRFAFVLFDASRKQLVPPDVAVYVTDTDGRSVRGPFRVANESLAVAPPFQSQTVQADANAAKQVYVTHIPLTKAKSQGIVVVARMNGQLVAANPTLVNVGGPQPPTPGQPAISVHTPTSPPQPIASIDTRVPHDPQLHAVDFANVLGKKPVLLVFATPQLCQSRTCGPVVDQAAQLQAVYGKRMAFIHMEVYNNNDPTKGNRPQLRAWRLPSEPWVFAIDRHGRVVDRLEGASSIAEMRAAIEKALKG